LQTTLFGAVLMNMLRHRRLEAIGQRLRERWVLAMEIFGLYHQIVVLQK
jgi:hypothetical protein